MILALRGRTMSHLLVLLSASYVLAVAPARNPRAAAVRHLQLGSLAVLHTSCRAGPILLQPGPILRGEVLPITFVLGLRLGCKLSSLLIREGTTVIPDLLVHSM
jgi:hypothetical protein